MSSNGAKLTKSRFPGIILFISFLQICSVVNGDLYNNSDPIVLLNVSNFHDVILGTENAWIVEFYASWCGHCINFAPIWREFSIQVMDWDHTIKVAVLDCADEENGPTCRDYEVSSYPTIRLFGSNTQMDDLGTPIRKGSSEELQQSMIIFLKNNQENNLGSNTWVNLLPYEYQVRKIFDYAPSEAENAVLIVDDENSMLASQCILDLGNFKSVYIRKINSDSPELDSIDIPSIPAVIVVNKTGKYDVQQGSESTREEITALIMLLFQLQKNMFTHKPEMENKGTTQDTPYESISPSTTTAPFKAETKDQVYMVDVENALVYALSHEVALNKIIIGDDFQALVNFTNVLIKYLPTRPQVHNFLRDLLDFLKERTSIAGDEFEKALSNLQSADSILPKLLPWKGCLGSDSKYRGYPCGLWTVFHTLTVNAVLREEDNPSYDPLEVMQAIHGFVKYLFSCRYCSEHFQKMYAEDAERVVQNPNDEINWLWKAHNKVNVRLQGDESEDPQHPKHLFPTKERCPQCWKDESSYNLKNVNSYLKSIYGESAISYLGIQDFSDASNPEEETLVYSSANLSFNNYHFISCLALLLLNLKCFSSL